MHNLIALLTLLVFPHALLSAPNILWLTSEDNGPHLGCYGDAYADTPNLDKLATKGTRYLHASSNAPVCAPARTTIIAGMYPTSLGAEHMRSNVAFPEEFQTLPQLMREAGYYCTNHTKEDYNYKNIKGIWNESGRKAHWKNRPDLANGQGKVPFFAVFNFTISHESKIRNQPHKLVHDPAKARVPDYHPDLPEVRRDWAQYYDRLTEMDAQAGARLQELGKAGLLEDTIIFYYSDHGSGMPRSKRCPYRSGLQVPLIVHIPEKYQHLRSPDYQAGGTTTRPVAFVDLAATALSLAGATSPEYMHGQAFLGTHQQTPKTHTIGYRGRMDERYDLIRSVWDGRYLYVRNFMPHLPLGQYLDYMFQTPTTAVWHREFTKGTLTQAQSTFWQPKATEELYDLQNDPDETINLAIATDKSKHQATLERMRTRLDNWVMEYQDLGYLPEAEIHRRAGDQPPYHLSKDQAQYPIKELYPAAKQATSKDPTHLQAHLARLQHSDPGLQYWGLYGLYHLGAKTVRAHQKEISTLLTSQNATARIAAAHTLATHSEEPTIRQQSIKILLHDSTYTGLEHYYQNLAALNALDYLDQKAKDIAQEISNLPEPTKKAGPNRMQAYIPSLKVKILQDLDSSTQTPTPTP